MYEALKAENLSVKKELENLREEVRSTYLSKNVPCGIDKFKDMVSGASQKLLTVPGKIAAKKVKYANDLPKKPVNINRPGFKAAVPTIASIAAKNVPEINKAHEWIMIQGKGSKKSSKSSDTFPDPVKNPIEQKRR
ncbi:hypothetical protein GcM3_039019, partial [Golovinomyces cichoracearum]